jgi:hypothetical protein
MNEETRDLHEKLSAAGQPGPGAAEPEAIDLSFYCIPAPPVVGRTSWSVEPWLPE